ncbi:hypothetical protein [Vibrio sp. 10N.261.55.A7]|uniref:hypothetical protein n=1 Tax=Vibrio TaxID=662 RepID=UPI000C836FDC|nr:hypothetical protein [Vibrio sp. 10N.261.55.A7]PMJ93403.1 hypothetical protein BCU12_05500 [Vibrio sp. 10N.261.55.A7]
MSRFFIVQLLTIVLLLFYSVPNYLMPMFEPVWLQPAMVKFQTLRSQGVATLLAEQLNAHSTNEQSTPVSLDNFPYLVEMKRFNDLNLTGAEVSLLKEDGFMVDPESLNSYKIVDAERVLVIGNPDIPKTSSMSYAQREIMGTVFLLTQRFEQTPMDQWNELAEELTVHFRYPIDIQSFDEIVLSSEQKERLKQGELMTELVQGDHEYGSGIDRFYQQLSNGRVLVGGPIAPFISDKLAIGITSVLLALGLFNALMLILWLLPTWRTAKCLDLATKRISEQIYTSRIPILFASLLNPQARTFNKMADRTEQLFHDNQQLIYTFSNALSQPVDEIEHQLDLYKKEVGNEDRLDQMELLLNDMRDLTSLILLIGKFNREKDNSHRVTIELSDWINRKIAHWQIRLDREVTLVDLSEKQYFSSMQTCIDPYFFEQAILSLLSIAKPSPYPLELYVTANLTHTQIKVYQCEERADTDTLKGMNEEFLFLLAQHYKGQVLHDHLNCSVMLEVPNVLS